MEKSGVSYKKGTEAYSCYIDLMNELLSYSKFETRVKGQFMKTVLNYYNSNEKHIGQKIMKNFRGFTPVSRFNCCDYFSKNKKYDEGMNIVYNELTKYLEYVKRKERDLLGELETYKKLEYYEIILNRDQYKTVYITNFKQKSELELLLFSFGLIFNFSQGDLIGIKPIDSRSSLPGKFIHVTSSRLGQSYQYYESYRDDHCTLPDSLDYVKHEDIQILYKLPFSISRLRKEKL